MKILMVSSFLPYPLFSGGHVRLYNIIKYLSKRNQVKLVCEKRDYQSTNDIKEVKKICQEVIVSDRRKQWTAKNIVKTALSSFPFLMIGHLNTTMKRQIEDLLRNEKFDLIHAETFYIMQNIPKTNTPIILAEHNIEYLVYQRFMQRASPLLCPFLSIDILKMRYWEEKFWNLAGHLIAVSEEEKKLMNKQNVSVIPNGVDIKKYQISNIKYQISKKEKHVLFIGDFKWIQNRDAAEWILKEIWHKINSKLKTQNSKLTITLWIVSRQIPKHLKNLTKDVNIIFDENSLNDTGEIFKQADVLLAPIRVGGGTSFKILEAMASGVPVVTTRLGIEGIEATIGKEVLVGGTVEQLADKTLEVLRDENEYKNIARNARKLIEEKYNWEVIVKDLEQVYRAALG